MTQATPGPWKAHPIETSFGLPYTPVSAKTLIARVYSEDFEDYAQSEANARLIAAAPALLQALEWIIQDIPADVVEWDRRYESFEISIDAIKSACAAIRAAKGE